MATFDVIPEIRGAPTSATGAEGLGGRVLLQNAHWFTHIRWAVVVTFLVSGALNISCTGWFDAAGLVTRRLTWPWVFAAVLSVANIGFRLDLRRLSEASTRGRIELNIWFQIVVDLLILTLLIALIGPLDTAAAFAYLFHIVMACIFFTSFKSLTVAALSATLFTSVVMLQAADLVPPSSIVQEAYRRSLPPTIAALHAASIVGIWFIVWYLAATISQAVRKRDRELAVANEGLREADAEKTRQVLRVTHDLKAPFSGIESNIQVLHMRFWEVIPEAVQAIIERIQVRSQTLSARISDILTLGDLRSRAHHTVELQPIPIHDILERAVDGVHDAAAARGITIDVDCAGIMVRGDAKGLLTLFANLLANAVFYSHEGGKVEVAAIQDGEKVRVRVQDHGIGIPEDALPHIFDEFFRTKEAMQFNKRSTGLGLPIVKTIAQSLGLHIRVDSEVGEGTCFETVFDVASKPNDATASEDQEGRNHG